MLRRLQNERLRDVVQLSTHLVNGLAMAKPRKGDAWCRRQLELWTSTVRPLVEQAIQEGTPP